MIEGAKWKKWVWFYLPLGTFIVALLFPFYWMVNGSLQPNGNTLQGSWWPAQPDLGGYWSALQQQGANLLTSLVVAATNEEDAQTVVVRPVGEFGVRYRARIGPCGPPRAALIVLAE